MEITVTKHAQNRIKERMGINKKAATRQFALALERGENVETAPYLIRQWAKMAESINSDQGNRQGILYNNALFMYNITDDVYSLITVLNVPKDSVHLW